MTTRYPTEYPRVKASYNERTIVSCNSMSSKPSSFSVQLKFVDCAIISVQIYARTAEMDCPSEVPGLSIPIGLATNDLPIGIQLHTRPGKTSFSLIFMHYSWLGVWAISILYAGTMYRLSWTMRYNLQEKP